MGIVKVSVETKAVQAALKQVAKQIPYAAAKATNALAFEVMRGERLGMTEVFKHPRPFTRDSVRVERPLASKTRPFATVYVLPDVAKYLMPYEKGGLHVLPGQGRTLLNPKDTGLDPYGQMRRNTTAQLNGRKDVFVGAITTKSGQIINGFWQRLDVTRRGTARRGKRRGQGSIFTVEHGALKLLIRFGDAVPVKQHLGFEDRARAIVAANVGTIFEAAMTQAIATMK
jgi:hypothetical protein